MTIILNIITNKYIYNVKCKVYSSLPKMSILLWLLPRYDSKFVSATYTRSLSCAPIQDYETACEHHHWISDQPWYSVCASWSGYIQYSPVKSVIVSVNALKMHWNSKKSVTIFSMTWGAIACVRRTKQIWNNLSLQGSSHGPCVCVSVILGLGIHHNRQNWRKMIDVLDYKANLHIIKIEAEMIHFSPMRLFQDSLLQCTITLAYVGINHLHTLFSLAQV